MNYKNWKQIKQGNLIQADKIWQVGNAKIFIICANLSYRLCKIPKYKISKVKVAEEDNVKFNLLEQ